MKRLTIAIAASTAFAGCFGTPQGLPVDMSICSAAVQPGGALDIVSDVRNRSTKPMSRLDVTADFYQSFRYVAVSASAVFAQELDPGQQRRVSFSVSSAPREAPRGQAIRCYATHVGYLDGTSEDAPLSR